MKYAAHEQAWQRTGSVLGEAASDSAAPTPGSHAGKLKKKAGLQPLRQIVSDMAFSANGWYAATDTGLLKSTDRGVTWIRKPLGPLSTLPFQSVRVSPDGERLWVVSLRGLVFSMDGGNSWSWHDLPLNSGGAISLEIERDDPNTMISTANNGLYISRDAGNTWQQAGAGLPYAPVQAFATSGSIFLASMRTGGLYVSSDAGGTWARMAGTIADGFFPAIAVRSDAAIMFAASATEGLFSIQWREPLPTGDISPR
jgi:photosystem II stability/assembly factor-like uncharacterized protein